jgi:hypothetical protein
MDKPAIVEEEHLDYLDGIRESGQVNMFGAAQYIAEAFGLSKKDSRTVLMFWMETFSERQEKKINKLSTVVMDAADASYYKGTIKKYAKDGIVRVSIESEDEYKLSWQGPEWNDIAVMEENSDPS